MFPAGTFPQVAINDKKMYPIYAKCVELGIPVFCCAGVPGPRLKFEPQHVEYIDEVMYDFPELIFVTRHGCEPWQDLAVKLMLKWPGLHYSTSAFAPKHYPKAIIDYANTRGADKIIYAGYFPMGLSIERIMTEMPNVGLQGRRVAEVPPRQRDAACSGSMVEQITVAEAVHDAVRTSSHLPASNRSTSVSARAATASCRPPSSSWRSRTTTACR